MPNDRHFANVICKFTENLCGLKRTSPKFVPSCPIDNKSGLLWRTYSKFVMQRPPSQLIRCWTWSVDFSNFGVNLTKWNGADVLFTTINLRVIEKNNHNWGMVMFQAFSATVSHWLGANLESALRYVLSGYRNHHFFISGVYHIPSAILVEINIKMPPLPCHDCQIFIIGFPI